MTPIRHADACSGNGRPLYGTALFGAIMSGLYKRERTGGCHVSTSLAANGYGPTVWRYLGVVAGNDLENTAKNRLGKPSKRGLWLRRRQLPCAHHDKYQREYPSYAALGHLSGCKTSVCCRHSEGYAQSRCAAADDHRCLYPANVRELPSGLCGHGIPIQKCKP